MNLKYVKFIPADLCVVILLLLTLMQHFTVVGLVAFLVGSLFLFLGTLLDKKKAEMGISAKLGFILFMTTLTLFGIWSPFVFRISPRFRVGETFYVGMVLSVGLSIAFFIMSGNKTFQHYVVRRCLKYAGQAMLFGAVFSLFGLPIVTYIPVLITVIIALLTDLFATKCFIFRSSGYTDKNDDAAFWMAMLINACFAAMDLFFGTYLADCLTKTAIVKTFEGITSGFYVPLFIIMMVVLAAISLYVQEKEKSFVAMSDGFLTLSLGGFALLFRVFESNFAPQSFILLCAAVLIYFIFGYSIPSAGAGNNSNPVYFLLRYRSFGGMAAVISVTTTLPALVGIIYAKNGYLTSILFAVCGAAIIVAAFVKCRNGWIQNNIRWQVALVCVTGFAVSVAVLNSTLNRSAALLIGAFAVCSLAVWTLGMRQDEKRSAAQSIAQGFVCVAMCAISMAAVAI